MRVTLDAGRAVFHLAFEFVEAAAQLMIELAFFEKLVVLLCEGALDALQLMSQ